MTDDQVHDSNDDQSAWLAIKVLQRRAMQLPIDDRKLFSETFPYVLSEDSEERESAVRTVHEILNPQRSNLIELPTLGNDALKKWREFISGRIRSAREKAGMTQTQLSEQTGIALSYISSLENGEISPTNKTLVKIAHSIGIPVSLLDPSA